MSTKKKLHSDFAIIKPTADIRLDRLKASREAVALAKTTTITLSDFIKENYHVGIGAGTGESLKVTIRDIGLMPFEIDIYDARIIVVEVTGKARKDFDGKEVPERLYRSRCLSIGSALKDIADMAGRRKLQSLPSNTITLRDYHNAYAAYWKYVASVVNPAYNKALDVLQEKFPFTQISQGRSDEENWFNN